MHIRDLDQGKAPLLFDCVNNEYFCMLRGVRHFGKENLFPETESYLHFIFLNIMLY